MVTPPPQGLVATVSAMRTPARAKGPMTSWSKGSNERHSLGTDPSPTQQGAQPPNRAGQHDPSLKVDKNQRSYMKPYGIPRDRELDCVDLGTIAKYGLKSSWSQPTHYAKDRGRHNSFKRVDSKARVRRVWKGRARAQARKEIRKATQEL